MTEDNVILQVAAGLPPFLNPVSLAEKLYPGVAVSVQTSFKDDLWSVESFILASSSVSIKKEGIRRLLIGLDSLPDSFGETQHIGFNITISDDYVVEKINSDVDVNVIGVKIRLLDAKTDPQVVETAEMTAKG